MLRFGSPFVRFGAAVLCLVPLCVGAAPAERVFGVVPQLSPSTLAERWIPLLDRLSQSSAGPPLRFVSATSIAEFDERALAGAYDYLYVSPLLFRQLAKTGYRALARDNQLSTGLIVVRADGPKSLAELKGRTLAFPAARAIGATLMTRADLRKAGISHSAAYLGTHESAYRAVIQGQYPAAGGVPRTFEQLPAELRGRLRILHQTESLIAHPIAVHPRVPEAESRRVQRLLLQLDRDPAGAKMLAHLGMQRLVPVTAADIASLENVSFPERPARIRLHVIPRLDETATRQHMLPLAAYLRQRLDLEVELRTYSAMDRFQTAVYQETQPALVNANPIQALELARRGYETVAQQLAAPLDEGMRSLIVVREDSPARSLADLADKRIAFGAGRDTFFASVVPRAMLQRAGVAGKFVDATRPGPVSDVLPRLRDGEIDAGAIGNLIWHNAGLQEQYIRGHMRILAQSEPLPGLAWLVGPKIGPDLRDELQYLLVNFHTDAPGRAAMRAAGIERLKPATNATYAPVAKYAQTVRP